MGVSGSNGAWRTDMMDDAGHGAHTDTQMHGRLEVMEMVVMYGGEW